MGRCDAGRFRMNKPPGTRVVHPAPVGWKYPGVIMSCPYAARMFWLHHGTTSLHPCVHSAEKLCPLNRLQTQPYTTK